MVHILSLLLMLVIATLIWGIGKLMVWIGLIQTGVPFWLAIIAAIIFMIWRGNALQKKDKKKKINNIKNQINDVDRILKEHNM